MNAVRFLWGSSILYGAGRVLILAVVAVFLLSASRGWAEEHSGDGFVLLKIPAPQSDHDRRYSYDRALLHAAMKATEESHGPYLIATYDKSMIPARARRELLSGRRINVLRNPTSIAMERVFLTVRVPIFKGMLGQRVLLINGERAADFAKIRSLSDLRDYSIGQGLGWNDVPILEDNGLTVVEGQPYPALFDMLSAGRFDGFSRGVTEVAREMKEFGPAHPRMVVENTLLLRYPFPVYFFVSPAHPEIAARLRVGLNTIIENGTLDRIFTDHYGAELKALNLESRRVIELENRFLPDEAVINPYAGAARAVP